MTDAKQSKIVVEQGGSKSGSRLKGANVKYMNTYRLESKNPFSAEKVDVILREVVIPELEEIAYDPIICSRLAVKLTNEIRQRVKLLDFDRYKIICKVDIGEKGRQGLCSALRFLWDADKDNYTYLKFENMYLYVVAAVFGVYYN